MSVHPNFLLEISHQFLSLTSSIWPGIVMQEYDTITKHASDTSLTNKKQITARTSRRDHFSKHTVISIALTRLRIYTIYQHNCRKTTCAICLHSGEKYSLHINYFSNAVAGNPFFLEPPQYKEINIIHETCLKFNCQWHFFFFIINLIGYFYQYCVLYQLRIFLNMDFGICAEIRSHCGIPHTDLHFNHF